MTPPTTLTSLLAMALTAPALSALAQSSNAGQFVSVGNTQVSAMMMFLGNEEKVYILDKAENNAAQMNGHPAWGAVWDLNTKSATLMDVVTNTFCAAGMHVPNGSFVTFGGNGAVGPQGSAPNVNANFDSVIGDWSGSQSIRVLNPCTGDDLSSPNCQWFDNASQLAMQKERWYAAAEPLSDGSIAIIGGFVNGGYINRNSDNADPAYEGGAAEPTYEFYPSKGEATVMQFMITTSGLNSYAHTFMMPSGKMFIQANLSTILWEPYTNNETPLPDMPHGIPRVYPASGGVAMLPLTPENNWTPTIIFCGGTNMTWEMFGNYSYPTIDTFYYPASNDCQLITPEPTDGSSPNYVQDDNMPGGRTMGQFITLPTGELVIINGAENGTAGYSPSLPGRPTLADMPYGESLSAGPVGTPWIYNPKAAAGSRWSQANVGSSNIARLYHSSALLLPDASVLVAGSNPNIDVNTSTIYPTTYTAEVWYPPYFAFDRPTFTGAPANLTYGGNYFNLTVPASGYSGDSDTAAENTTVVLMRPGFTTHAMNMGQRHLQLNNTYTVNSDGSLVLHVSQPPPNANLLQPGPVYMFVVVNGVPSNGSYAIVGTGDFGTQPTLDVQELPPKVQSASTSGSGTATSAGSTSTSTRKSPASRVSVSAVSAFAGVLAVVSFALAL